MCATIYVHSINECFHHQTGFSQTFQLLFMFQCNEHVEINKFLSNLACTWMTIIDSQIYILDSLSLYVSLEYNANSVVVCPCMKNNIST